MRIVSISDTHTYESKITVPDGDMLIHAGDYSYQGSIQETQKFLMWFEAQPHKYKVFIAGNHDWLFETEPSLARTMVPDDVIYLHDRKVEIEGLVIYGSPYQPEFCNWAFNLPRGEALKKKWSLIPENTDVLITHGPPLGILDLVPRGEKVGCADLLDAVYRIKPQLHVFGHIHNGYGMRCQNGTTFVNASICDERYLPINAPIIVDL